MSLRKPNVIDDLQSFGPQGSAGAPLSRRQSRAYCRRMAKRHYENFTVASRLVPAALRPHVYNIYAYCRWADDLADETADVATSLGLLNWWEAELRECYAGRARHPVFIALRETIDHYQIPIEPFIDLLVAFRQDQRQTRYETRDDVLGYCRYSANPVGRLVLWLGRAHTAERCRLSDAVCTGLQLANFCQDVAGDWDRGRVYLPQCECRRYGYDGVMFARREHNDCFRQLLAAEVDHAEGWLKRGAALVPLMPYDLQLMIALFVRGGQAVLQAIRDADYDVWTRRPKVRGAEKLRILARAWWQHQRGALAGGGP